MRVLIQVRGRPVELGAVRLPLGLRAQDLRRAFGQAREVHLDRRKGDRLAVAQHADVELPPFDVLLDQGRVVHLFVDLDDPLHQRAP